MHNTASSGPAMAEAPSKANVSGISSHTSEILSDAHGIVSDILQRLRGATAEVDPGRGAAPSQPGILPLVGLNRDSAMELHSKLQELSRLI